MAWTGIRKQGDIATNARKRYYRDAERYLKQAEKATGATKEKYREMARIRLDEAINTYTKKTTQNFSKPIQRIANELGVDLNERREQIKSRTDAQEKAIRERAISETRSREATRTGVTAEELRQREARAIFNTDIGSRIIGGTVEIWNQPGVAQVTDENGQTKIDKRKILPAIFDFFKIDNLADLISKIVDIIGDFLFKSPDNEAIYESAKIGIQRYVKQNGAMVQ